MTYYVGQVLPLSGERGITAGPEIEPVWHGLLVPPQREFAAIEGLKKKDIFAFCPKETRVSFRKGKKIEREYPSISRIIYAKFTSRPQFDVMRRRNLITGVFSINGRPIVLGPDTIRALQGIPTEAERLEAERRELMRLREGDRATIEDGPLAGVLVDVTSVREGMVWFQEITVGFKGRAYADKMRKVLR